MKYLFNGLYSGYDLTVNALSVYQKFKRTEFTLNDAILETGVPFRPVDLTTLRRNGVLEHIRVPAPGSRVTGNYHRKRVSRNGPLYWRFTGSAATAFDRYLARCSAEAR